MDRGREGASYLQSKGERIIFERGGMLLERGGILFAAEGDGCP
jgi:hypothetical protein